MIRTLIFLLFSILVFSVSCQKNESSPHEKRKKNNYTDAELLKRLNVKVDVQFDDDTIGFGSGVCLGENIIATNYHVIFPLDYTKKVKFQKLTVKNLSGEIVDVESVNLSVIENDIVILKTNKNICSDHVPLEDIVPTEKLGEELISVGNPGKLEWTVAAGNLTLIDKIMDFPEEIVRNIGWITADTNIYAANIKTQKGSSGGAVYNNIGLIGIIFALSSLENGEAGTLIVSGEHIINALNDDAFVSIDDLNAAIDLNKALMINLSNQSIILLTPLSFEMNKTDSTVNSSTSYNKELAKKSFDELSPLSVRFFQYFSFTNGNASTLFIQFADTNYDNLIDTKIAIEVSGFHKYLPQEINLLGGKMYTDHNFNQDYDDVIIFKADK